MHVHLKWKTMRKIVLELPWWCSPEGFGNTCLQSIGSSAGVLKLEFAELGGGGGGIVLSIPLLPLHFFFCFLSSLFLYLVCGYFCYSWSKIFHIFLGEPRVLLTSIDVARGSSIKEHLRIPPLLYHSKRWTKKFQMARFKSQSPLALWEYFMIYAEWLKKQITSLQDALFRSSTIYLACLSILSKLVF